MLKATKGPTAAHETTETSKDTNRRIARSVGNTLYRRDVNHRRDASTSSRRDVNSSMDSSNNRDFSHSRDSRDINCSKNNSSSRGASNSREHEKSWNPRIANGRNCMAHIIVKQQQKRQRKHYGQQHHQGRYSRDVAAVETPATAEQCRMQCNFANQEA
jgi:hypothetical protein